MSVTLNGITYSRIGTTNNASVGSVSKSIRGDVFIYPEVQINGANCIVTEIGSFSFSGCENITNIILPSTITTLRIGSFTSLNMTKPLIIPSSVVLVESWFVNVWSPSCVVFCGTKEPTMKDVDNYDGFISTYFKGKVVVSYNYNGEKFCLRDIKRKLYVCDLTLKWMIKHTCLPKHQTRLFLLAYEFIVFS